MEKGEMMNKISLVFLFLGTFLLTGCATVAEKPVAQVIRQAPKTAALTQPDLNYEADAVVVRAKKLTKLELKRIEATRLNNKDTTGVIVGSAGAIAAFTATNAYLGKKYSPWVSMAVSAGAAYAVAGITGVIFDALTGH